MVRKTFLVTVDCEHDRLHLRILVENAIADELRKKKHRPDLGDVQVHVRQAGELEEAVQNLAWKIQETARDAVDERIR